jgi:hypothetical protein
MKRSTHLGVFMGDAWIGTPIPSIFRRIAGGGHDLFIVRSVVQKEETFVTL